MTHTFIKDEELIEESYQIEDLLNFKPIINDFKERINKIKKNSIVGLIGPYGSGKSTMLYQIYKDKININNENKDEANNHQTSENEGNEQTEQWFVFDAWKYPERKDLWEGFVLDIAKQHDKISFDKARNKIDGKQGERKENATNTMIDMATITMGVISLFSSAGLTSIFAPIIGSLKNLTYLFRTSPVRRVFEFQELLSDIIKETENHIFIIIEDIDRSGDMGIFFLETLKHFIKNLKEDPNRKVIVIVPIGNDTFYKYHPTRDSYLKILDYQISFNSSLLNFTKFIENTIDIDIAIENFKNAKEKSEIEAAMELGTPDNMIKKESKYTDLFLQKMFITHIRYLFETMILNERQGTIRDIKSILRKVNSNFNELDEDIKKLIDIRILMLFTAIGHFYRGEENDPCSFFAVQRDSSHPENIVTWANDKFWGKDFFIMIMQEKPNIDEIKLKKFTIDTVNTGPLIISNPVDEYEDRDTYYIMDIYFKITKVHINYLPKGSKL